MKIFVLSLFILICMSDSLNAQVKRDTVHYHSSVQQKKKLKEELGLDKKQAKALKAMNKAYRQKAFVIKSDSTIASDERREQLRNLNREKKQRTDSILTPQQRDKLKSLQKEKQLNKLFP